MKDGQTFGQWLNWDFKTHGNLRIKDKKNNLRYIENLWGYWVKWEYDSQCNCIYSENSDGEIRDNRTPEVIEHNGRKYKLIP
jgi:hypothetical protein